MYDIIRAQSVESTPSRGQTLTEATSWLGTPYHHRGRIKGVGVDCAMLPLAVYSACGLIEEFEAADYPADWHLHRGEERYLNTVMRHAREIAPEASQPGDLVLFRIGRCFSHGAIVLDWPRLIHARLGHRVMIGSATDPDLIRRERRAFTLWS